MLTTNVRTLPSDHRASVLIFLLSVTFFVSTGKGVKERQTRGMITIPRNDCVYICTKACVVMYLFHLPAFFVLFHSILCNELNVY